MKPEEVSNPTPEQMTAALLKASRTERWNHWRHEVDAHTDDWVITGDMREPMKADQFAELPEAVACYQFVELCVYSYQKKVVWGFYCKKLPFKDKILSQVLVVLNPAVPEIIHCMRSDKGKRYCERWGEQEKLFTPVRW